MSDDNYRPGVQIYRSETNVEVWLGFDLEDLEAAQAEYRRETALLWESEESDTVEQRVVPPTFACTADDFNALIVEALRGPQGWAGHPGPTGPTGMPGRDASTA